MMDTILNLGLNDDVVARPRQGDGQRALRLRRLPALHRDVLGRRPRRAARRSSKSTSTPFATRSPRKKGLSASPVERRRAEAARARLRDPGRASCRSSSRVYKEIVVRETGKRLSRRSRRAALGRDPRRLRELEQPPRQGLPQDARHPRELGHRVQRAGDGLRQPRRRLRHRRRVHARSRRPARAASSASGSPTRRARTSSPASARRSPCAAKRSRAGRRRRTSLEAKMPDVFQKLVEVREQLEKHFRDMQDIEFTIQRGKLYLLQCRTGKRTGARRRAHRRRDGEGGAHHRARGRPARRPGVDRSAPPPGARSQRRKDAPRARPAGEPRRGERSSRLQRRRGRAPRRPGQGGHPGARRDVARRHPRHEGGARHPHGARRDDEPRRRRRARHGQVLRRRLLGDQRRLRASK